MQDVPAGYEAAWAAKTNPSISVRRNGAVIAGEAETVEVRRDLTGDLPAEVSFIGGSAAASATIAIDTRSSSVHPLTDAAAVLGRTITVAAGFGGPGGNVPLFTGTARGWAFGDAAGAQSLSALDGSDLLRAPVTLHGFGSHGLPLTPRNTQRYPTNSAAVVVAALHACGIRVTPDERPGCVASLPLVGGALADRGAATPTGAGASGPWLASGRFGPVPAIAGSRVVGVPSPAAAWDSSARIYVEWWHYYAAGDPQTTPIVVTLGKAGGAMQINVGPWSGTNARKVWVNTRQSTAGSWEGRTSGSTAPTLTAGWHRIAVELTYAGVCTCWVDDTSWVTSWAWSTQPETSPQIQVEVVTDGRVQAVQLCRRSTSDAVQVPSPVTFASAADVDTGALEVDVLPAIDGREAWALLTEVAKAELGSVGFNESGRFQFRSRASLNATSTPVEDLTGQDIADVGGRVTTDGIRTRVTTKVTQPWFVDSLRGADVAEPVRVLNLTDVVACPSGQTTTILLSAARAFMPSSGFVYPITLPGGAYNVDAGIVMCTDAGGSFRYTAGLFTAALEVLSPTTAKVSITNLSGLTLYPVWPAEWESYGVWDLKAGSPALWVLGYLLSDDTATPTTGIDVTSAALATWGDRLLELPASPWRTNVAAVTALATAVLADVDGPRVVLDQVTVEANPRRQLGDVLTVPTSVGPINARVVNLTTRIDLRAAGRMEQTIGLRALAS